MVDAYEAAAELLVVFYLRGRAMDDVLFQAAVRAAHQRLVNGESPVLDVVLRHDIDAQADRTGAQASASTQVDVVAPRKNFA